MFGLVHKLADYFLVLDRCYSKSVNSPFHLLNGWVANPTLVCEELFLNKRQLTSLPTAITLYRTAYDVIYSKGS